MSRYFVNVAEAVDFLRQGQMLIVVDSVDRENEGDFLAPAESITADTVHKMITFGRGQVCLPLSERVARRVGTRPLMAEPDPGMPRYALPLDHVDCTTGISPEERAHTMRKICDPSSSADDFVRPGHIFPLVARGGGVLERPGHTETSVELMQLAGLSPVGVLCEICSRNGRSMATSAELMSLAQELDVPMFAIDTLIAWRRRQAAQLLSTPSPAESPVASVSMDS